MCPDIGRSKMLFDTEAKARNFIKFNGEEITDDTSKLRVYWCAACGGYHISSHEHKKSDDGRRTKNLIKAYERQNGTSEISDIIEAGKYYQQIPDTVTNNNGLKKWVKSIKMKPSVIGQFYKIAYENRPELKAK